MKGSNYLETLAKTKYVVFDKTGTLTKGVFQVTDVKAAPEFEKAVESGSLKGILTDRTEAGDKLLELAAYAESYSNHPISKSLKEAYGEEVDKAQVSDVEEISGHGVKAQVSGHEVAAGNFRLMESLGIERRESRETGTTVHVAVDGMYAGDRKSVV